jgi:hypothetical protein
VEQAHYDGVEPWWNVAINASRWHWVMMQYCLKAGFDVLVGSPIEVEGSRNQLMKHYAHRIQV